MKLKIAVRLLGHKAPDLDIDALKKWKSCLWELCEGEIDSLPLNGNADLPDWGYSDAKLTSLAVPKKGADVTICILNGPLEDNYYSRRLSNNTACLSLYEVTEALRSHNIPLHNIVLRMIYSFVLIYTRKQSLPSMKLLPSFAHHETKGCIFDMTGIKTDIVFSCDRPVFCTECRVSAKGDSVPKEWLDKYEKEIRGIRKALFYRLSDKIKQHPIWALFLSSLFAVILGIIGSLIASAVYDCIKMNLNVQSGLVNPVTESK